MSDGHRAIATAVVSHFTAVQRDLPWRRTRDPYAIWVSEIMLQQTRVATVIPYWERWMAKFPTVTALSEAVLDDVLAAWAGLGYYTRARNLHAGARTIVERWAGELPRRASELRAVRGIGAYTAGAIASIAYGERAPLVDGNVARVVARVFGVEHDIKSTIGQKTLWRIAGELMSALPETAAPGDLNQGLMELGATLCSPTSPNCLRCPLATTCVAARDGRQDVLPVVAKRTPTRDLPILARDQLWIEEAGEILLVRRRPEGLFGGLWELPPIELAAHLGIASDAVAVEPVAYHDQTLTHRRLRVRVRCAPMSLVRGSQGSPGRLVDLTDPGYDAIVRVTFAEARSLGIAAATTAILARYEDIPWSSIPKRSPSSRKATTRSSKASRALASTSPTRTSPRPPGAPRKGSTSSSTTRRRSSTK